MADGLKTAAFIPALFYLDPFAALDFLERAFGFERTMVITDEQGNLGHSQIAYRDGVVMVGTEWSDDHKSPVSLGRKCTQTVHVHLDEDIDAHCARARAAGAEIVAEPQDQFYGDRTYRARDPEGHMWTFSQPVRKVSREDAEKASGLKIESKDWA
jgi:uncharacterized glyoxalase superfamily protein PhnB